MDERDYLRRVGIGSYIKQYVTFHTMRQQCGDNLFMLPYEQMVRDRDASFRAILGFLGFKVDDEAKETAFQKALNASTAESLRNLEKSLGSTHGRDQADAGETHIRGGEIGKWKQCFDDGDLAFAERALNEFGLSLDSFDIE